MLRQQKMVSLRSKVLLTIGLLFYTVGSRV